MTTESNAAELEFFNDCIDELATDLVKEDLEVQEHSTQLGDFTQGDELDLSDKIQKGAWAASLLASSDNDEYRRKALAFSVMSYVKYRDTDYEQLYRQYLYISLSRLGNLPAFNNVDPTETETTYAQKLVDDLDSVLGMEIFSTRSEYKLDPGLVLSRFQRDIYGHLTDGKDVAISGPTSSGKSFILKRYIEHRINDEQGFKAIYVVPTRALISEVSRELSDLHNEVVVKTGAYFEEEEDSSSDVVDKETAEFLVVTPERCRKLINPEIRGKIEPDLVFFDEIQNIEDDNRGVLFEGIVESLNDFYPDAQIVAAGPYLENPGDTLEGLTKNEVEEVQTGFTPVLQLKVTMRFNRGRNNDISLHIHSPSGSLKKVSIPEPDSLSYSDLANKTEALPTILDEFASNSKTLVYSGRKDYAEKRAKRIAEQGGESSASPELRRLKEFLAESIHEEYSLIECLERGVAFHHGNVPKFAREEIEEIYRNYDDLHTIVTTPTLMQGVNLPAEKIFLVGAKRGGQELTDFEFNNLIGRVGRLDTNLYGSIYCIEREEEEWADEKLESASEKEVDPATSQAISESEKLILALQSRDLSTVEDAGVKYTAILLRGKYLKDDQSVSDYLDEKGMDKEDIDSVEKALEMTLDDVDVPKDLLRQNPTVDPVKLDELYQSVSDYPERWIMKNNRFKNTYKQLLRVARRLNEIFKFTNDKVAGVDPEHVETEYGALGPIIVNASQWLSGNSYQAMIESRRDAESVDDDEDIDTSIREVMSIVDNDICFLLVKYFGILISVLERVHEDKMPDWMRHLDQMLEMGSMKIAELELMRQGVDRSVAVDLSIPTTVTDPVKFLKENPHRIPQFHRSHLEKQGIL